MARNVIAYDWPVGRWQPGARDRLERAALELFLEQGFADTTVPQITARAGLTTRTFFRYFADKREVLFSWEAALPARVAGLMAAAPPSLGPMGVIAHGLKSAAANMFEGRLEQLRARRRVIDADTGLRERELRKLDTLSAAINQGFRDRGVDELTSTLAAGIAVTVFSIAMDRWLDPDSEQGLSAIVNQTLDALRLVVADLPVRP